MAVSPSASPLNMDPSPCGLVLTNSLLPDEVPRRLVLLHPLLPWDRSSVTVPSSGRWVSTQVATGLAACGNKSGCRRFKAADLVLVDIPRLQLDAWRDASIGRPSLGPIASYRCRTLLSSVIPAESACGKYTCLHSILHEDATGTTCLALRDWSWWPSLA